MRRADILGVGFIHDFEDGTSAVADWHMQGGEAPAWDGYRAGGWTIDELRVISILWHTFQFSLPLPGANFGPSREPQAAPG